MKIYDLNKKYDGAVVLSLGFFDCIHLGHASLIKTANEIARSIGAESFVMTFSNDPSDIFGKSKQIYTFEDRIRAIENLGADGVVSTVFDEAFSNLSPQEFLKRIFEFYDVKKIVVGADYTFGINAEGDVDFLKRFCEVQNVGVEVVPFKCMDGLKLSTRALKGLVETGDVATLNARLSEPYFMTGEVSMAKHNGTRMGFPTANISQNKDRFLLADGVYATKTLVDGREYISMTNVGAKPTFNDFSATVETHIMGFDGDLYGKTVIIRFFERLRNIKAFATPDDLKEQLTLDEQRVKTLFSSDNR
ncbi:MAG: riboflavin biosynthesis protein RibF [Clostridia bacterium]|nr:riboflavin biosynthesis protein RibF [Clostridia bacterium]